MPNQNAGLLPNNRYVESAKKSAIALIWASVYSVIFIVFTYSVDYSICEPNQVFVEALSVHFKEDSLV